MSCVIIDDTIKDYASKFPDKSVRVIANALGLWWEANQDKSDEFPSTDELNRFISSMRESSPEAALDDVLAPETNGQNASSFETQLLPVVSLAEIKAVELAYDPAMRRDRVSLVSRLFSNEVDLALEEAKAEIDRRMMEERLTDSQRNQLREELYSLDRIKIMQRLTPGGIFDRVREGFENYVNDTNEGRVQAEVNKINQTEQTLIDEGAIEESERFTEAEKLEAAKKKAAYKYQEYQKLIEHFQPLAEEAAGLLLVTEGIRVDPNYMSIGEVDLDEGDPVEGTDSEDDGTSFSREESVKDGWMTNFRQVSSHASLSQAVRKVIRETPKLDREGFLEEDDLGNQRYLDADYVHATLIDKLRNMITAEDMRPLLVDLARQKPWVEQIIETLDENDSLFSQFYQDFRKDFVDYWIQKKRMRPDGSYYIETIAVNKPEGVYYLFESWRDNYESGTLLDKDSVYEKNGDINRDNAAKGLERVQQLNNKFNNKTSQEGLEILESQEVFEDIVSLLNMIGVDPNPAVLRMALSNIKEVSGIEFTPPIKLLIDNLNIIFSGIKEGKVKSKTLEDGTVKRGDLLNTFGSAYNGIASMLAEVTEDAIESSVRENDKSYYSHVNPSYLGKLLKQLKNVTNKSPEEFARFIEEEFGQYDWFKKDGVWMSDWVKRLAEDPSARKAIQHKVVLNHDKIEYQDWDDLDTTIVLLSEYFSEPREKMAWYHVPILSDAPSAEFIKFYRFTNGSESDSKGNKLTFQQSIISRMVNLVNQEYDRIMRVRERKKARSEGRQIEEIDNFDSTGDEFKFLPQLNTYTFSDGETFMQRFERLREGSPSEFRDFIEEVLYDIMEEGFEQAYQAWFDSGLMDELPNGNLKHPIGSLTKGQSQTNQNVAKALNQSKEILGSLFTGDMQDLLDKYSKNKPVVDKQATKVFGQVTSLLNSKLEEGAVDAKTFNNIIRFLNTKNNIKDTLREYYYNSEFATSQIIQLTTTDLAFYKGIKDFQKRYKEVHAPSLRLNTMAKFNGETVGRTWERTIYLMDNEIVSTIAEDVEDLFLDKYNSGEISEYEAASIISKYGVSNMEKNGKKYYKLGKTIVRTSLVNVADAQAYRSLSSYRAVMCMSGQWTDEMETAYKHLTDPNGGWTMNDFNVIWQTKKPYVYTQVNNNGIKTPVQHKNSEFLLLAIYDAVSNSMGKSSKLRAINDFMEQNQIDVVQFESTTKVGGQGKIDLNYAKSYEQTMQILKNATGISSGQENPNVVHKVSYEDYGIQTATPEHIIDAIQLIGTQIRKLITADMADDIRITIDGKTMTKSEWLNFYNAINTENILQSFIEVDRIFEDPKEIEKALQEEIRGNPRYGTDMLRACTYDEETQQFNIPLYDPIQSERIQTLLNSIIKSRITKQQIKGGSLIQVSAFGLHEDLKIVFEGEGKNRRIKYFECYMPAYSKSFYQELMDENGVLDVNKLHENLRRLIGYRV